MPVDRVAHRHMAEPVLKTMVRRDWGGEEWANFARRLVQLRHKPQNVQDVPDTAIGDAGIDFFTTDGCCYQCYAPRQSSDTSKAASAMKGKATKDLKKLTKNKTIIEGLLGGLTISRWILLCPFLDDKLVIAHVRSKSESVRDANLDFIANDFCAMVHSLADFGSELRKLQLESIGIPIEEKEPSIEEAELSRQQLHVRMEGKLLRGFPTHSDEQRAQRALHLVLAHITCGNTLDHIRQQFPDLWESYRRTVRAEERRLQALGLGPGGANERFQREFDRLREQLTPLLSPLDTSTVTTLATGTLANWLIECPLDLSHDGMSD